MSKDNTTHNDTVSHSDEVCASLLDENTLPTSDSRITITIKMRCPYPECQKDYNDDAWPKYFDNYADVADHNYTDGWHTRLLYEDKYFLRRIYVISRQCRFCKQLFHEIYMRHENREQYDEKKELIEGSGEPTMELLASYPTSKTKFESKKVPKNIRELFNEAERCRSVGALTGVSACLRKTVYAICDEKKPTGEDYREKITNLPVSGDVYKDLLRQVKFLGDNMTKANGSDYTEEQIDKALTVLPLVIDKLYEQDEKIDEAQKILAKVKTQSGQKNK